MLLTSITFILLACAFISAWMPRAIFHLPLSMWILLASAICGVFAHIILPVAIIWIVIGLAGFLLYKKYPKYGPFIIFPLAFFILAMGMNLLPGFNRVEFIAPELLGKSNIPFGLNYTVAKPLAGLLVLFFIVQPTKFYSSFARHLLPLSSWTAPIILILATGIFLGLSIDIKYVWWTPLFVLTNTFFTVIPEEAFFRGFLQRPLQDRFGKNLWILLLVGTLFAAAHPAPLSSAPWKFYGLMIIAGTAYAWSFYRSNRIETSIVTHAGVNSLHFLLLTYPLAF